MSHQRHAWCCRQLILLKAPEQKDRCNCLLHHNVFLLGNVIYVAYSKLIIDNIAKNDGNLMIFGREEKLAGSAGDGVAEVFESSPKPRAVLQPVSSVLASKKER